MSNTSKHTRDIYISNGIYYGYPRCCINEFIYRCNQPINISPLVCVNGFIPCKKHTQQIIDKVIDIKDLIKNRECIWEFPKDDEDAEYEEECENKKQICN